MTSSTWTKVRRNADAFAADLGLSGVEWEPCGKPDDVHWPLMFSFARLLESFGWEDEE